jgi:hypothetical protein
LAARRSGAAATFGIRRLGAQQVQARALQLVQRPDLGCRHHPASCIEGARPQTEVGGRQRALSSSPRVACQRDGALQERSGRGEPASRLRTSCRVLQFSGHVFVGSGCRQRAMPGTTIRVDLRVAHVRQGPVHPLPVARRRRLIDGRSHQWMTKADPRPDLQKLRILRWGQCARLDPKPLGRAPEKRRVPHRIRGRQQHQLLRRPRQFTDAPQVVVLDMTGEISRGEELEAAGQSRRADAPRQLQESERVSAGLGDDPVADVRVEQARHGACQQRTGFLLNEPVELQLGQAFELAPVRRLANGEHDRTDSASSRRATNPRI